MKLRLSLTGRPILTILVIAMLGVGLACAGEKATPTSPPTATTAPTATATTAPTATLVPTATATLVSGAPTATAVPTATATSVPDPTATAVPLTWIQKYMQSAGYKPEWGQPHTGGIVKLRSPRTSNNFTPSTGVTTTQGLSNSAYYNTLIRVDPWIGWESIIGDLAKSWEMSGDGLQITFKLEEGVKFQNNPKIPERLRNADFTCEDVAASTERSVRPPKAELNNIVNSTALLTNFKSVSCPDGPLGYTAVMYFNLALGKTIAALASGHFVMLDKGYIDWLDTEKPGAMRATTPETFLWQTGSGPFVPLDFQPDVVAKVRRNPTYFREGLPLVDGYDWLVLKDYTTAFTALATGNIHIFERGSWAMQEGQVAQADRDFKDRIVMYPALHIFANGIQFNNLARAPLNDRRVRKAMSLALNRDDYLLFRKAGSYQLSVLAGDLAPQTYWSYTEEELRTWPGIRQPKDADIAEANRLLDEVFGKGKRFSIPCQGTNVQDQADICLFFKDQMKRSLNIDVTLDLVEQAVSTTRSQACQTITGIGSSGGTTRIGDPDDWMFVTFIRKYAEDLSSICQTSSWAEGEPVLYPELEALAEAQSTEMDPVKRRELVQRFERKFFDEMVSKILFGWNFTVPGTTKAVKGYYTYKFNVYPGMPLYERLWLAK